MGADVWLGEVWDVVVVWLAALWGEEALPGEPPVMTTGGWSGKRDERRGCCGGMDMGRGSRRRRPEAKGCCVT